MGRPATVTGVLAIAKAEMISRILQARSRGVGYREIAALEGISPTTACRWYWRTMRQNPPNRRRQRAALERAVLGDDPTECSELLRDGARRDIGRSAPASLCDH
jgi:hypothetical protein